MGLSFGTRNGASPIDKDGGAPQICCVSTGTAWEYCVVMVFMVTTHDAARRCTGGAPDSSISIVTGQGDGDGSNYSGSRHGYMLASARM